MARGYFGHSADHARAGSMSRGNTTSGPDRRGGRKPATADKGDK